MASIIIPSAEGYKVAIIVGITKKVLEWEGSDDVEAHIQKRTIEAGEAYQQERQKTIESLGPIERLKSGVFGSLPKILGTESYDEWNKVTDWRNKQVREDLTREETRYRLGETGQVIPVCGLEFLCIEPVEAGYVKVFNDGFFNSGYQRLLKKAIEVADRKRIPYVALSPSIDEWIHENYWITKELKLNGYEVTNAKAYAQFFVDKSK